MAGGKERNVFMEEKNFIVNAMTMEGAEGML
jgi:hypothetical protein